MNIAFDFHCLKCEYNLRMQPIEGRCPECGELVSFSVDNEVIRWGPAQVTRLERSTLWMAYTTLAYPAIYLLGRILIIGRYYGESSWPAILMWLVTVAHVAAAWVFTAVPQGKIGFREVLIRAGSVAFALSVTCLLLCFVLLRRFLFFSASEALFVISIVLMLGATVYVKQLGDRISDLLEAIGRPDKARRLAVFTRVCLAGVVILWAAGAFDAIVGIFDLQASTNGLLGLFGAFILGGALAWFVGGIGLVIGMLRLASGLRRLLEIAWTMRTPSSGNAPAVASLPDDASGSPTTSA
jgi:hypothetical protein